MLNSGFVLDAILKKNQDIIWSNNRFYNNDELLKRIDFWRKKIKESKIRTGSLIAFESEFNFNSISFFLSTIFEKLIVAPLPKNQKHFLKMIPCKYYVDLKKNIIIKKKCKNK